MFVYKVGVAHNSSACMCVSSYSAGMAASLQREPPPPNLLYLFYDCEGSGGSAIRDHIIEVAVVIFTDNLGLEEGDREKMEAQSYSSLCQCDGEMQQEAQQKHGLDAAALEDQPSVCTVLIELFKWIANRLREVQRLKQEQYQAVLVSHGGNAFDFPLLVTEVKRNNCDASFRELELFFTDTHTLCEQLRASGNPVLRGSTKLSLSELHSLFFPTEVPKLHRAHRDALTLKKLFTETPLSMYLQQLELTTTETLVQKWCSYVECQQLTVTLGLQKQKAKVLIQKGATLQQLEEGFRESGCSEQWLRDHLRSLGIRRPGDSCLQHFRQIL